MGGRFNRNLQWIATFVIVQKLRTKNARETLKGIDDQISSFISGVDGDIDKVENFKPFKNENEIKESSLLLLRDVDKHLPFILDKYLILFKSNEKFWISDNPLSMQNTINTETVRGNIGFGVYGIEIYLPISPSYVLGFYCKNMVEEISKTYFENVEKLNAKGQYDLRNFVVSIRRKLPIEVKDETVENLNSLQVYNAERFIFSKEKNFGLAGEMIKDNNKYMKGPRPNY